MGQCVTRWVMGQWVMGHKCDGSGVTNVDPWSTLMYILIGNPCIIQSRSFSSLWVAVHYWQLAPHAPDRIDAIFPSNILIEQRQHGLAITFKNKSFTLH